MKSAVIIAGKYTQDHEFIYPFYRLQEAGYSVDVAVRGGQEVQGFLGAKITPTKNIPELKMADYDLLVLPGGAKAMEYIRQDFEVIQFIHAFHISGKVIASICHGAQLLISANVVKGNQISGYYSIEDDINNAGARYVNAPVVVCDRIVTSPHYKYLGLWMKAALDEVEKNDR